MGFTNLFEILRQVRSRYPAFGKRIDEVQALARWEIAVGPAIARHSRAIRVQDGVLWVEVDHPIWKSELHHRKRQILEILNRAPAEAKAGPGAAPVPPPLTDLFFVDSKPQRGGR